MRAERVVRFLPDPPPDDDGAVDGIGYVHVSMDINRVQGSLERLEKKYQAYGIELVSGIAAEARKIAYRNYFHRTGGTLRYNSPRPPQLSEASPSGTPENEGTAGLR